jgi:hypothetical protein
VATKIQQLEKLKVDPMYRNVWARLKPLEKMFVTDTLIEWEDLDINTFYHKMNRLFINSRVEKMNGTEYFQDDINPQPKVGDTHRKPKHRMGSIMDLLGSAANMQSYTKESK